MSFSERPHAQWTSQELIERILTLESKLQGLETKCQRNHDTSPSPAKQALKSSREINPSKYSSRFIALKFAYLGKRYNGYEYAANNTTPLPTVEETLWKALMKARLIFPKDCVATGKSIVNWNGCEYTKCGRTDRGVSAFGQVIGIRVRSNRPLNKESMKVDDSGLTQEPPKRTGQHSIDNSIPWSNPDPPQDELDSSREFHPVRDEIPYPQVLNRLLPPDIRVLAWCPNPPVGFSARFSCRERQYRYFFTQPAFNPTPYRQGLRNGLTQNNASEKRREGWLDIEAMNKAASKYVGLHDFRNLCKVDASKQLSDFKRRIFTSEIREVDDTAGPAAYVSVPPFSEFQNDTWSSSLEVSAKKHPRTYVFVLHGSAFLWHQVRHMVAILFLVGQGLESPDIVDRLLDVESTTQKPVYEMADDTPLVLWDCVFPREGENNMDDSLDWVCVGDGVADEKQVLKPSSFKNGGKFGVGGVLDETWKLWHQTKMNEILAGSLLNLTAGQGNTETYEEDLDRRLGPANQKVYQGGVNARTAGRYVPLMERRRLESPQVINQRYAAKRGFGPELAPVNLHALRSIDTRSDHLEPGGTNEQINEKLI